MYRLLLILLAAIGASATVTGALCIVLLIMTLLRGWSEKPISLLEKIFRWAIFVSAMVLCAMTVVFLVVAITILLQ